MFGKNYKLNQNNFRGNKSKHQGAKYLYHGLSQIESIINKDWPGFDPRATPPPHICVLCHLRKKREQRLFQMYTLHPFLRGRRRKCLGNSSEVRQNDGRIMAESLQNHAESWKNHGRIMAGSWQNHGRIMAESWQNYGRIIAESSQNHGRIMAEPWKNHGRLMEES